VPGLYRALSQILKITNFKGNQFNQISRIMGLKKTKSNRYASDFILVVQQV